MPSRALPASEDKKNPPFHRKKRCNRASRFRRKSGTDQMSAVLTRDRHSLDGVFLFQTTIGAVLQKSARYAGTPAWARKRWLSCSTQIFPDRRFCLHVEFCPRARTLFPLRIAPNTRGHRPVEPPIYKQSQKAHLKAALRLFANPPLRSRRLKKDIRYDPATCLKDGAGALEKSGTPRPTPVYFQAPPRVRSKPGKRFWPAPKAGNKLQFSPRPTLRASQKNTLTVIPDVKLYCGSPPVTGASIPSIRWTTF